MPIDHGDFLGAMQIGASIAERRMQLKAQAAMQALKEREMAQQADFITQRGKLYEQQALTEQQQRLEDMALTRASADLHKQFVDQEHLTDEEATARTLAVMATRYPKQARNLAAAYAQVKKGQQEGQPTPADIERERHNRAMESKASPNLIEEETRFMRDAEARGDQEVAALHKARLTKLTQSTGMTIKTNPDGTMELVQGPMAGAEGQLTKPNQTKVQASLKDSLEAIDTSKELLKVISPSTVGARAAVENVVFDKVLAQKFPELANKDRAKATVLASSLRSRVVRMNKTDGNISEKERGEILKAFPQINAPLDSPENARNVVRESTQLAATHAVRDALALGVSIPKEAAMELDDKTICRLYDAGVLTSEQAVAIGKLKRGKE